MFGSLPTEFKCEDDVPLGTLTLRTSEATCGCEPLISSQNVSDRR